jgi:parallel beta-helix repeat protein
MADLNNSVISEFHGKNHPNAHGLTIFFPNWEYYTSDYNNSDLDFTDDTLWDEFIFDYLFQIKVDKNGLADYKNIQDAIDNSSDGDSIYVDNGIYKEQILINKSITIVGKNQEPPTIDGGNYCPVIKITSDKVNFTNFNIKIGSKQSCEGIFLESNDCYIFNNHISNFNNYGCVGIFLRLASNNSINYNLLNNGYVGIGLSESKFNTITNNTISTNIHGSLFYFSDNNEISYNGFQNNNYGLNITNMSFNNTIFKNSFYNNTKSNAYDTGVNFWYSPSLKLGNYWGDYFEKYPNSKINYTDILNHTGVWDTPYEIPGGNNTDMFPLFNYYGDYSNNYFRNILDLLIYYRNLIVIIGLIIIGLVIVYLKKKRVHQ